MTGIYIKAYLKAIKGGTNDRPFRKKGDHSKTSTRNLIDTKIKITGGPFFLEPEQHTVFSLHRNESLRSFKSRCATFISLKLERNKYCKGGFQRRTLSGMTKLIVRGIPVLNLLRCETVVPVRLSKTINPASGIPLLCMYMCSIMYIHYGHV